MGGTVIDLEDRLFSRKWAKYHEEGKLPRETRILERPQDNSSQGAITLKVDILERRWAAANPLEELLPPQRDWFELRVIVWEATEVALKDDGLFGGAGKSDVFVTITPRGGVSGAAIKSRQSALLGPPRPEAWRQRWAL